MIFCLFRVLTQVFLVNIKFEGVPGLIRTFYHCLIDYFSPGSLRSGLLRLQRELGGPKKVIFCLFRVLNYQGQPGLIHTFFHCSIDYFSPGSLRIGLLRLQSELGSSKNVILCLFRVLTQVF